MEFNPDCCSCPRLVHYLQKLEKAHPQYHNRPVAGFGDQDGWLYIVGLAPGLHGANASGRPFTGDKSGEMLFRALFEHEFASSDVSRNADDGLQMQQCYVTNAVKCVPPSNLPSGREIRLCNRYLQTELGRANASSESRVILALGKIAHDAVLKAFGLTLSQWSFAHAAKHEIAPNYLLLDSFHCSRYNVQTKRLNYPMFSAIFSDAKEIYQKLSA